MKLRERYDKLCQAIINTRRIEDKLYDAGLLAEEGPMYGYFGEVEDTLIDELKEILNLEAIEKAKTIMLSGEEIQINVCFYRNRNTLMKIYEDDLYMSIDVLVNEDNREFLFDYLVNKNDDAKKKLTEIGCTFDSFLEDADKVVFTVDDNITPMNYDEKYKIDVKVGDRIIHQKYGLGKVVSFDKKLNLYRIQFEDVFRDMFLVYCFQKGIAKKIEQR